MGELPHQNFPDQLDERKLYR